MTEYFIMKPIHFRGCYTQVHADKLAVKLINYSNMNLAHLF